ncbi:hypothetical protein ACI0FM_02915 [Paenochrobactrum sp. BZR 588]|uniref:hypothetical protein n=1 Tax=unclassified Paenochrobactrum TaxID=2639760 RepID=UPI0038533014
MTNILTDELLNAADMRISILKTHKFDKPARYGARLCEDLAAANNNDPVAVNAYVRLRQDSPEKLHIARLAVMSKIGYGFEPNTPDDVVRAIVEKAAA